MLHIVNILKYSCRHHSYLNIVKMYKYSTLHTKREIVLDKDITKAKEKYFYISSLAKGIKVLELLAEKSDLSVTDVAKQLGINRAASHRFISTLRELGYVEKNVYSKYGLTFKIFELGMKVVNRFEIRRAAPPFMQKLASLYNETVNFACLDNEDVVHIDKIDCKAILRIDSPVGSRVPAYCTALGKSILAFLPQEELASYLKNVSLKPLTPNTITSKKKLKQELDRVRSKGVAVDNEELSLGLRCVGAPILDHSGYPRHAMSVSGVAIRMPPVKIKQIQEGVRNVCEEFSSRIGGAKDKLAL